VRTPGDARLTVCVPAYQAASFVDQTLAAIAGQSEPRFNVLIADDGSSDGTGDRCRVWTQRDARFRLRRHATRLGWVDNVNWLLRQVDTEYFCLLPHDDLPDPTYLARLLSVLTDRPDVVCAYTDIQQFGDREGIFGQESISGPLPLRFQALLERHYAAVAFRGVTRSEVLHRGAKLRHNRYADRFCDTVWMSDLVAFGELARVAEPLYRKRYADTTVHASWLRPDPYGAWCAWVDHSVRILARALACDLTGEQARLLAGLTLERALALAPAAEVMRQELSPVPPDWLLAQFLAAVVEHGVAIPTDAGDADDLPADRGLALRRDLTAARTDAEAASARADQVQVQLSQVTTALAQSEERTRELVTEGEALRVELGNLTRSRSWRLTAPLRGGARRLRSLRTDRGDET
jgi:hypothetical protein